MGWYIGKDEGNYICHHGIKGQKWGVRRYQNEDGTLTDAGRERYYVHAMKSMRKTADSFDRLANGNQYFDPSQKINKAHKSQIDSIFEKNWSKIDQANRLDDAASSKLSGLSSFDKKFKTEKYKQALRDLDKATDMLEEAMNDVFVSSDQYIRTIPKEDRDMARAYVAVITGQRRM